jgi:Zn-dependent protease
MNEERFKISAGAIGALAVIYYLMDTGEMLALLLPVLIHELGHLTALKAMGLNIQGFKLELKGCCIEYDGGSGAAGNIAAALAGPFAGILYALAAAYGAERLNSPWLELSAGVSLLLAAFNLLPVLPLDGGRALSFGLSALLGEWYGERILYWLGLAVGAVMLGAGIWLMVKGWGVALALAAVWILMYQNCGEGIVKPTKML